MPSNPPPPADSREKMPAADAKMAMGGRVTDWEDERERPPPVAVPHAELTDDALRAVVKSFVLREGTDYGEHDVSHENKVAQVIRQLERGEARIMFDPVSESVDIVLVGSNHGRP